MTAREINTGFWFNLKATYTLLCVLSTAVHGAEDLSKNFVFKNDSCNNMKPVYVPPPNGPNHTELITTDNNGMSLHVKGAQYRRNGTIEFDLMSNDNRLIEKFMVAVHNFTDEKPTRIGSFVRLNQVKDLQCDSGRPLTAVISVESMSYTKLATVTWQAPDQDFGSIAVNATILAGDNMWLLQSHALSFSDFPPSLAGCNSSMSCATLCPKKDRSQVISCSYVATWKLTDNNETLDVVFGGHVDNGAIGVGFVKNVSEFPSNMALITLQTIDEQQTIKAYYSMNDTLHSYPELEKMIINSTLEAFGDNNVWASITLPFPFISNETMMNLSNPVGMVFVKWSQKGDPADPKTFVYSSDMDFWEPSLSEKFVGTPMDYPLSGSLKSLASSLAVLLGLLFLIFTC